MVEKVKSKWPVTSSEGIIIYDFLLGPGGAEAVTLALSEKIKSVDMLVAFRNRQAFPDHTLEEINFRELLSFIPRTEIKAWRTLSGIFLFRWCCGEIAKYEWAIFSGSNAPMAVHARKPGRNLLYCHTPPRFAYDLYSSYLHEIPAWQRPIFRLVTELVRRCYERAISRMDCVIANSRNVQYRLSHYLGVDSVVVHPPCDTKGFKWLGNKGYFLSMARLEPFKRVSRIIEAFKKIPDKELIVASGGSEEQALRRLAAGSSNIHFTGWQSNTEMRSLVGYAAATIYVAQDEDFGMSPVESMAAGKPVIGVAEGGLLETIIDGVTGALISKDCTVDDLISAVKGMDSKTANDMRLACEQRASDFSEHRFLEQIQQLIHSTSEDSE